MFKDEIERVMHELPYGLYIIGSREEDGGKVNGMMADWVMQVSFEPRLVAVAFEGDSHTLANIRARTFFTVNLLSQGVESMDLARRFAQPYSGEKVKGRRGAEATAVHYKLDGLPYDVTENGCPVLEAAMAWFECRAEEFVSIGDHIIAVGRVLDGAVVREAEPLTSTYTGWTYSG
jgi:flavin reductase (DIM6/NTAB) family NADH-FMN oxidoreductase RutF